MYEKIKGYYEGGLWDLQRVYNVVGKAITPEEYELITGYHYESQSMIRKTTSVDSNIINL